MGLFINSFTPLFLLVLPFSLPRPSFSDQDSRKKSPDASFLKVRALWGIATAEGEGIGIPVSSPPEATPSHTMSNAAPFVRPSIPVVIGVVTTTFFLIFLLLLYANHYKAGNYYIPNSRGMPRPVTRKNSGIVPMVIDSLPLFHFGSLRGQKEGLDCAVCLNSFQPAEVLRLLPKCKHAFHVECLDTWLRAHSTCPMCRSRVHPEDVLLNQDKLFLQKENEENQQARHVVVEIAENDVNSQIQRVPGRHSSAGESASRSSQLQSAPGLSGRLSFDMKKDSEGPRKDRPLLGESLPSGKMSAERRAERRIIGSDASKGIQQRWSDAQASDFLYLQSEMLISDSHRCSSSPSQSGPLKHVTKSINKERRNEGGDGKNILNNINISEIVGKDRFSRRESEKEMGENQNNNR